MTDSWDIGGEGGNSFQFLNHGDFVRGQLVSLAEKQQTDVKTGEPKYFSNGDPMNMYVVVLATDLRDPANPNDDGKRTVYLKGSRNAESQSSLGAVLGAVKTATGGTAMAAGGTLTLQYIADGEPAQRGFTAPKLYAAWYEAPAMNLGGQPPGQAAPPVQAAPPQQPPAAQAAPQQPWIPPAQPAPTQAPPAQAAPPAALPSASSPALGASASPEAVAALAALGITPEQLAALAAQNAAAAATG